MCKPYSTYQLISSTNDLNIVGSCLDNCNNALTTNYLYEIFIKSGSSELWTPYTDNQSRILGSIFVLAS